MKKAILFVLSGLLFIPPILAGQPCFLAKENGRLLKQEGDCSARHAPWCTFNIAISMMGYESGILTDQSTPTLQYQPSYKSDREVCRQPHVPSSWMKHSVVWYSQAITQKLGMDRFKDYVAKFDYGNQKLSGDKGKNNGLTNCWLSSSLQISGEEQVEFLQKLLSGRLPVSKWAQTLTRDILYVEDLANGWKFYGKTGGGPNPDNTHNKGLQMGWFVGWIEKADRHIAFAHYIEDTQQNAIPAGRRAKETAKAKLLTLIQDGKR